MKRFVLSMIVCALLGASPAARADDDDDDEESTPEQTKAQKQAAEQAAEKAARLKKAEEDAEREAQAMAKLPRHPLLQIPLFEGAVEATEKGLRGLGLDAFDGYRVGAFFTNTPAEEVIKFYFKTLQKIYKREKGDTTLRFTLMIEVPSGENPLGEKIMVDQNEGGVKDETGTQWKSLITVYRKIVEEKKPAAPEAPKPEAPKTDAPKTDAPK